MGQSVYSQAIESCHVNESLIHIKYYYNITKYTYLTKYHNRYNRIYSWLNKTIYIYLILIYQCFYCKYMVSYDSCYTAATVITHKTKYENIQL